jgi:hypothetical protein
MVCAEVGATAVAEGDQDTADLRLDVVELRHDMNGRFAKIEGMLGSNRWKFGIIITMQLASLLLLLRAAVTS